MSRGRSHLWFPLLLLFCAHHALQASDDGEKRQFQALVAWMQSGIAEHVPAEHLEGVPQLDDVLSAQGRTLTAKRDLREGELLMRLPQQRLMHAGYYLSEEAPIAAIMKKALESEIVYVAPQTWMAVYMMEHRKLGRASDWYPYLNFLPEEFPGNPIFYGDAEYKWLEGSTFVHRAKTHATSLEGQYKTVSKLVPGFAKNFSKQEFLWARSAIATRVFGWDLPAAPSGQRDFMVPLGDMLNHRSPKQVEWVFNSTTNTLDYWMRENVTAGEELLISYGTKSNAEYMLHYGFAVAGLPSRNYTVCSVKVAMGIDGIPDQQAKRKWLIKASFSPVKDHAPVEFNLRDTWEKEPERMLAHARLLVLPDMAEVERHIKRSEKTCVRIAQPPNCPRLISKENERAALERCLQAVNEAVGRYPTTLEEDQRLLPTLEGLPKSLVTLRRDEKFVLQWWQKYFSLAIAAFTRPSIIAKRCRELLGPEKCTVEENPYMFQTLADLLRDTEEERFWLPAWVPISLFLFGVAINIYCMSTNRADDSNETGATKTDSAAASRSGKQGNLRKRQGQR